MLPIFNDLNDPLTQISRARHYSTLNISEMIQDGHMVNIHHLQKVICGLLNCAIANGLDRPSRSLQLLLSESVAYSCGL